MTNISYRQMQSMLQRLSPQQIQMIKLLELPTTMLEQRIKQEIEENPVLDEVTSSDDDMTLDERPVKCSIDEFAKGETVQSYKLVSNNYSKDDQQKVIPLPESISFIQFLENQLDFISMDRTLHQICLYIISDLDVDGYLRRGEREIVDDFEFKRGITITPEQVEESVKIVQSLEPAGVGCRDLKESLMVQLLRKKQSSAVKLAYKILSSYFEEFAKKHYSKIMTRLALSDADLKEAINAIISLSPKPSNQYSDTFSHEGNMQIIPDFVLEENNDGELELSINRYNTPDIKINNTYIKMLEEIMGVGSKKRKKEDNEAAGFIKQKIDSARWFISAIKQRDVTLMLTMHAILEFQRDYFVSGEETDLRPMILKDIASKTNLDVSTVSRVVGSKHIQTPNGIFPLKFFFSEAMQREGGEEVSSREVKSILLECVENEDKSHPLTDEALMDVLKERGYIIARRTVDKYREVLNIQLARLRRVL